MKLSARAGIGLLAELLLDESERPNRNPSRKMVQKLDRPSEATFIDVIIIQMLSFIELISRNKLSTSLNRVLCNTCYIMPCDISANASRPLTKLISAIATLRSRDWQLRFDVRAREMLCLLGFSVSNKN